MDEPSLDEFAEEHPTVAAPGPKASDPPKGDAPVKSEALVKIVITDEQLASSWDMFPQEESSHPATADLGDIPLLSEPHAWVRSAAPAAVVARQQPARRSLVRPAAMVIFVVGALIGGRMVMDELNPPPPAATPVVPAASAPPAADVVSASEPPAAAVAETSPNDVSVEPRREIDTPTRAIARQAPARVEAQRAPARAEQQRPGVTRSGPPPRSLVAAAIPAAAAPAASQPSFTLQPTPAPPSSVSTTSAPPPVAAAPPVREEPRAAEAPTAPAVAASTPPTVAAPAPPPAPAMTPETRAVFLALNRYQQAYSTLDAEGVHDVWPGVDVKALDRAFNQLDEQTFDMQRCEVTVAGARAEATCDGTASYVRKVGRKAAHLEPRRWLFTLRQDSDQWVIDRVQVR